MSDNIYAGLPEDLVAALKRCDVLAGPEQLDYYYNLYDPETGGFYYSISSRDTREMTPFAEGTSFTLEALRMGGMTLPDWYKEKVGPWIQNHQDESDGFFYEDLWGKITSGPRLNRDLSYSRDILSLCGLKPKYPLPQERLKGGEVSSTIPAYLENEETMLAYLDSLDWSYDMIWSTGQRLTTARTLIEAAGLLPLTREYIKNKQNPETGLFGDGFGWMNTNGAMKLSGFFDKDFPYPNVDLMLESVKKIYSGTPPTSATMTWNPFVLMNRAIASNVEDSERLRKVLYEKAPAIINCAIDAALLMKRADGGFASSISKPIKRQQGYLFGLALPEESDLDGTLIAGPRLRRTIHAVFGIAAPDQYYAQYNDEFWERCKNKAPIVKIYDKPDEPLAPAVKHP